VNWNGRWPVAGGVLAPTPHRPDGPRLWIGGNQPASLERAGRWFDGWFPNAPDHAAYATQWAQIRAVAQTEGRDPTALTGAIYLTVSLDEDPVRADARLNGFLEGYYSQPAEVTRRRQVCYAGPSAGVAVWYAGAGTSYLVLRFAGDHERRLDALAKVSVSLGWQQLLATDSAAEMFPS
jgi:alkanesulfonate monooxygenase SsuD/methylene tetrahydromethanopterin reductase-like flavin-dependent oxidoreductase (luciferase family)